MRPGAARYRVRNQALVRNLPQDCIVESPGFVDRFGLNMIAGLELPLGCAATCSASINVQRMAVAAAVTGDLDLLRLAVLHDPLVGAVCNPGEVWQMVDEMLVAEAQWLPQYEPAIGGARERLARDDSPPGRAREPRGSRSAASSSGARRACRLEFAFIYAWNEFMFGYVSLCSPPPLAIASECSTLPQ